MGVTVRYAGQRAAARRIFREKMRYRGSAALEIDEAAAQQYDETLEPKIKCHQPSQETFYILSQSFLPDD